MKNLARIIVCLISVLPLCLSKPYLNYQAAENELYGVNVAPKVDLSRNPRHHGLFLRPPEDVTVGLPRYGVYGAYGGLTTSPVSIAPAPYGLAPSLDQYYASPAVYGQPLVGSPIYRPIIQTPAVGLTGGIFGGHAKHIRAAENETKFDNPTSDSVNFIENSETDSQTVPNAQTTGSNGEPMDYLSLAANPVDDLGGQSVSLPKDIVEQLQRSLAASGNDSSNNWAGQIYADYQTNVQQPRQVGAGVSGIVNQALNFARPAPTYNPTANAAQYVNNAFGIARSALDLSTNSALNNPFSQSLNPIVNPAYASPQLGQGLNQAVGLGAGITGDALNYASSGQYYGDNGYDTAARITNRVFDYAESNSPNTLRQYIQPARAAMDFTSNVMRVATPNVQPYNLQGYPQYPSYGYDSNPYGVHQNFNPATDIVGNALNLAGQAAAPFPGSQDVGTQTGLDLSRNIVNDVANYAGQMSQNPYDNAQNAVKLGSQITQNALRTAQTAPDQLANNYNRPSFFKRAVNSMAFPVFVTSRYWKVLRGDQA